MGNLNEFFRDLGRNAYGLGENVASLGSAAIAEPVAGFAAMYDPVNGAAAIREGMTYTPRTQAGQMYQQGAARTLGAIAQPAMPVIETWQRGVDIAGGYSPVAGAMLRTVPAAIGVAMGAKPALQAGRQVSNSLGAMQARMIANANAPRTLNMGFRGQRGVFAGINALTADKEALAKAKAMIARGDFPDDVWQETGWGQGADGKWRFEINDSGSSLNMMNFPEAGDAGITSYLPEFLKHPQVYQNYPESKTMGVLAKNGYGDSQMRGGINGLMVVNSAGGDTAKSTVLHELQHAIQQKEGFASGGSPSQFKGIYNDPYKAYRKLAGEVEARMVQNRMDLTPEQRREIYPFAIGRYGYDDIPKNEQIIAFGNNKANAQRPLTEFEQAHLTAQRNAALPVNQGGLGLPANNTAMDRARAMGWDTDAYHGTDADISEFRGDTFATYTTDDPSYASTFKDSVNNVLPLKIKYSGVKQLDKELNHFNVNKYLNSKEHWLSDDVNAVKGIDAGSTSNATALIMPNQLRSRFAAFDPFNRDSSNLLAQSAKFAPAATLGALMANEKRKEKRN